MTPNINATLIIPEIVIIATIACVFLLDLVVNESRKFLVHGFAVVGVVGALVSTVWLAIANQSGSIVAGVYSLDDFALFAKTVFLASSGIVLLFGMSRLWKGEYCVMMLSSLLGAMTLASARDLILFVVAFELLAIPGYLLIGWNKFSQHGFEGALKYYLLGVVATAVMLYGISLLYGLVGATRFDAIALALGADEKNIALVQIVILFVVSGLAFKISAVPFHFWAPDAYQGAPIPVAAIASVVTKVAGLIALIEILVLVVPQTADIWAPMIWALSAASMVIGNLIALRQSDLIRLLAYSSIAHAGYMLVPLAVIDKYGGSPVDDLRATFIYICIYSVMNLGAFASAYGIASRFGTTKISELSNVVHKAPWLAVSLSVFMLSLAGMPPFGGWFAKLVIFQAGIQANSPTAIILVAVAGMSSVVGLVYYAGILRSLWLRSSTDSIDTTDSIDVDGSQSIKPNLALAIALTLIGVTLFGVFPNLVVDLGNWPLLAR